jgi:glutamate-5-semialdehyde dehydrogenase
MDIKQFVFEKAIRAKEASRRLAGISTEKKNACLVRIADLLKKETDRLLEENKKDVDTARQKGLSPPSSTDSFSMKRGLMKCVLGY